MLSWLVIFFASGSPQAIGQRVTLSALRVTAWVRVGPNLLGQGIILADTKTARSRLADRVIGRVGHTINAFGLFAPEQRRNESDERRRGGYRQPTLALRLPL